MPPRATTRAADRLGDPQSEGQDREQGRVARRARAADFKSVRGDFKFNANQFPVQN